MAGEGDTGDARSPSFLAVASVEVGRIGGSVVLRFHDLAGPVLLVSLDRSKGQALLRDLAEVALDELEMLGPMTG